MRTAITFAICFIAAVGFAQHDKVLEIREKYKEIKSFINASDPDSIMFSGLHCDVLLRNTTNSMWRAVGNYNDTIEFWYTDLMEAANLDGNSTNDSAWALSFVSESEKAAGMSVYREWLFDNGALLFFFEKMNGYDEESTWEYRYYFDKGKLIRFMNGSQIISLDEDPVDVRNAAQAILNKFRNIVR